MDPIPILVNVVNILPTYLLKLHFNKISHLRLVPPRRLFPLRFPTRSLMQFLSAIRATRPACLVITIFITLIIIANIEDY